MTRWNASSVMLAAATVLGISLPFGTVRADVQLREKDGWSIYTAGLIAVHYQLTMGDNDPPTTHGLIVGNKLLPGGATDRRDDSVTLSRLRSGFVGSQLGFGVNRTVSETTKIESLFSINIFDISNNRATSLPRGVDVREAWAALVTEYGTLKFGRMFSIFGSAHAPVVQIAHRYGAGHPCALDQAGIGCASVGSGPLYANFDAQIRYITPRKGGLEAQVSVSDPVTGPGYQMTPFPRLDADINLDVELSSTSRLRAFAQGVTQEIQRIQDVTTMDNPPVMRKDLKKARVMGGSGSAILELGSFTVGAGAWMCLGCGTRTLLEVGEAANPLSYDSSGELRLGRGFFGNASVAFGNSAVAAGGGTSGIRSTAADQDPVTSSNSVINQAIEWHVVLSHNVSSIVFTAEHMQWKNKWYFGEQQLVKFTGVGANYHW